VNEGIKNIQDVQIGDFVVTHKNRVRPVVQVHKNPLNDRKIYKLEVEKTKSIYVTGNHRFWSFTDQQSLGWNSIEELKGFLDNKQTCYASQPTGTTMTDANDPYLKIVSITETDRTDEYVYTLGVEEDHSYTVEGLLVENCYLEPWHADVEQFLE
jgi:intein/homing endonuclease